jgi:FKBP-type peptidyl-prolyl cis-trans isomerase
MQQIILKQGEGPEVKGDFFVEVHYKSKFLNGKEFDSS